jgi:putative MATE family efflux protein
MAYMGAHKKGNNMQLLGMQQEDWREIGSMSGPIFIEQLAMALLGMLISMLVKSSGLAAVAAVNLLNTLIQFFQQIFLAIGVAVTVSVSQHRGRGELEATGKTASQSMTLSLIISTVLAALCLVFIQPLLHLLLGSSEKLVYTYSTIYFTFCILSMPFISIYSISTAAIRGSGFPKPALVATLTNGGVNALFAILAVVWFHAGLLGVSISMLLARVFAAVVGMAMLKLGNENLRVKHAFSLHFDREILSPVIRVSIPVCLENLLFMGGKVVSQAYAVPFGTNAVAVNGIAMNIHVLMCVTGNTAMNTATPVIGRYIGMRDPQKARLKNRQILVLSTIAAVFSSVLIFVLTPPLAKFYTSNAVVQGQILAVIATMCVIYPVIWASAFVTPSGLRGAGDVLYSTYIAIASMLVMRIGVGYVFAIILKFGVMGIWIGNYADWALRTVCYLWRVRGNKWLQKSII